MLVFGIDPGLNGGIACINDDTATAIPMPIDKIKKEIQISDVLKFIEQNCPDKKNISMVAIENVHSMPKQGVSSTFCFGRGFGELLGMLKSFSVPHIKVDSRRWKSVVLVGTTKDKSAAIRHCQKNYHMVNLLATPRSRKPHDGMADAVCIAEYAKRLMIE